MLNRKRIAALLSAVCLCAGMCAQPALGAAGVAAGDASVSAAGAEVLAVEDVYPSLAAPSLINALSESASAQNVETLEWLDAQFAAGVNVSSPACSIGNKTYSSVSAALQDAKKGSTIKLLRNVEEDVTVAVRSITLDLNGMQLKGCINTSGVGQLTVTSSVAPAEGVVQVFAHLSENQTLIEGNVKVVSGTFSENPAAKLGDTNLCHSVEKKITADGLNGTLTYYETGLHGNLVETKATCSSATYWVCACGQAFTDSTGAQSVDMSNCGHVLVQVQASDPSCTDAGFGPYWLCSNCARTFSDGNGQNEIQLDSIQTAPLGHDLSYVSAVAPTATTQGHNAYYTCSRCGYLFKEDMTTQTTAASEMLAATGVGVSDSSAGSASSLTAGTDSTSTGTATVISFDNAIASADSAAEATSDGVQDTTTQAASSENNSEGSTAATSNTNQNSTQAATNAESGVDWPLIILVCSAFALVLLIGIIAWRMRVSASLPLVGNIYKPTSCARLATERRSKAQA